MRLRLSERFCVSVSPSLAHLQGRLADTPGRTLAFTRVEFFNEKDQIVAFGNHTKHMANSHQVVAFSPDGEKEIPVPENAPHAKDPALAKKK